jgi:hypothetical protein
MGFRRRDVTFTEVGRQFDPPRRSYRKEEKREDDEPPRGDLIQPRPNWSAETPEYLHPEGGANQNPCHEVYSRINPDLVKLCDQGSGLK